MLSNGEVEGCWESRECVVDAGLNGGLQVHSSSAKLQTLVQLSRTCYSVPRFQRNQVDISCLLMRYILGMHGCTIAVEDAQPRGCGR